MGEVGSIIDCIEWNKIEISQVVSIYVVRESGMHRKGEGTQTLHIRVHSTRRNPNPGDEVISSEAEVQSVKSVDW